jgi:hypothetical protein
MCRSRTVWDGKIDAKICAIKDLAGRAFQDAARLSIGVRQLPGTPWPGTGLAPITRAVYGPVAESPALLIRGRGFVVAGCGHSRLRWVDCLTR